MELTVYRTELIESSDECESLLTDAKRSLHSLKMSKVNATLQPIKDQRGGKDPAAESKRLNLKMAALKKSGAEQKFIDKAISRIELHILGNLNNQLNDLHPKYKFAERLIDSHITEYQQYIEILNNRLVQLKNIGL
jgi:hypothetical protein